MDIFNMDRIFYSVIFFCLLLGDQVANGGVPRLPLGNDLQINLALSTIDSANTLGVEIPYGVRTEDLTAVQKADIHDMFEKFDLDKNGLLTGYELGILTTIFLDNGSQGFKEHVISMVTDNGSMDFCEYLTLISRTKGDGTVKFPEKIDKYANGSGKSFLKN